MLYLTRAVVGILPGGFKAVEFPLDVAKDTGLSIAMEMAEQVELPQGGIETATELIGAFMLILIRHWRPSISTPQHSAASPQALTCYCD